MSLPVAFSPCPNDTFLFYAWATGLVGQHLPISTTLADVQYLNEWAQQGRFAVTKASIHCLGQVSHDYVLIPVGTALGHACGPKIIAKKHFPLDKIFGKRIAIPGIDTTAHLLFNLLIDPAVDKQFCRYDEVVRLVRSGLVDCGLILHETRFTYEQEGFVQIVDLGELWEQRYQLPLPLGGVIAKRSLGQEMLNDITTTLRASLEHARAHPELSLDYTIDSCIEKNSQIAQKHVDLYVNQETHGLSETGRAAIDKLFTLAQEQNLLPSTIYDWLFVPEQTAEKR